MNRDILYNGGGIYKSIDVNNHSAQGKYKKRKPIRKYEYPEIELNDDPYERMNNSATKIKKSHS